MMNESYKLMSYHISTKIRKNYKQRKITDFMNTSALRKIGLSHNEIKIYLFLLKSGSATAYNIGKKTGIYRVHVYDKIEKLIEKGLVNDVNSILPELESMLLIPREDTFVEVFSGIEGLKYFLKDIIKTKKDVLITGIDDSKYEEALSVFMKQYFRDLRKNKIKERVITIKKKGVFMFDKKLATTTSYRFLEEKQFNPTNTFVYG